jgi:hypothetical protein
VVWWSEFLATDPEARVLFPALPDFLRSSGSGTESTLHREYSRGVNGIFKYYLERNYRLCGLVVRVPGYGSRGPGSIPGANRFSEK